MYHGNRLTDNAFTSDDGQKLIERALEEVKTEHGWKLRDEAPLFSGNYYDSKKVGSFIARVVDDQGASAVLKIQLRPLPYDEGMIIRHIQPQIKSTRIRLPEVYFDEPWNEAKGYGVLISEDVSKFSQLWVGHSPTDEEMKVHEVFLNEFMHHVLPIEPYLPVPDISIREKYREAFEHFEQIARASNHRHIDLAEVEEMKKKCLEVLDRTNFDGFHFTHGHLSGMDIRVNPTDGSFVLFSNLLWSFRPTYYEVIFPLWVDIMGIRDIHVAIDDLQARIDRWAGVWERVMGEDPRKNEVFQFLILERSMLTVMLDLGASEWSDQEAGAKQALLEAWRGLFESFYCRGFAFD